MNWQEVCEDPLLQDLPYKLELNRFGQIVMSPASNEHGRLQTRIAAALLNHTKNGEVITECSVETGDGTKVSDVAWGSAEFFSRHGLVTPLPAAPEVCVEIVSPSNSEEEMRIKAQLYFTAGAMEVWICDPLGRVTFQDSHGFLGTSALVPDFPQRI